MDRVTIICRTHGEFQQSPISHVTGRGCEACGAIRTRAAVQKSTEYFIQRAKAVHGDMYDYSESVYKNSGTRLTIICRKHGKFQQIPDNHYAGKGCERCVRVIGRDDFIEKSKLKHNNKYNYDKIVYTHSQDKITITCPSHGDFEQIPASHMMGYGCINCKSSVGEVAILYLLRDNGINYKVQQTMPGMVYILPLHFDFYLPDINCAIEYDGIQHFEPLKVFGGQENFEKRLLRDNIKTDYCRINGIRLIRINYMQNPEHVLREQGII
jgi:hypothetical protein